MAQIERNWIEIPTGAIDSVNKVFTLSKTPVPGTLTVHINGQTLTEPSDFTTTGPSEFTLIHWAPVPDDVLQVQYHFLETLLIIEAVPRIRCVS